MLWVYFCVYGEFHQGGINKKVLPKAGVVGKNMKKEDGHMGGLSIEGGFQTFCTLWMELFAKIAVNYFHRKLHLRCLVGFWTHQNKLCENNDFRDLQVTDYP